MAKKKTKTSKAAPSKTSRSRIKSVIVSVLAFSITPGLVGYAMGTHGVPAARQEGCVTGVSKAVSGLLGQEADPQKVANFCTQTLGN